MHFCLSVFLEYGRKQVGQATSGSCGWKLPCDFRCGPLIMMLRNLYRMVEARFFLAMQSKHMPCSLGIELFEKMTVIHIYSICSIMLFLKCSSLDMLNLFQDPKIEQFHPKE